MVSTTMLATAFQGLAPISRRMCGLKTSIAFPFFGELEESDQRRISSLLREPPRRHRKQWEFVYI